MAEVCYDDDTDPSLILGKKVAVIGFGTESSTRGLAARDGAATFPVVEPAW